MGEILAGDRIGWRRRGEAGKKTMVRTFGYVEMCSVGDYGPAVECPPRVRIVRMLSGLSRWEPHPLFGR
jgi:hypothetical protein